MDGGGLYVGRRDLLRLVGLGLVVSACSSTSSSSALSKVPAGQRIPDQVLRADASFFGAYPGTWNNSDGANGAAMVNASLNVGKRTAHANLMLGKDFFGTGSSAVSETFDFNLDDFAYEKPPYYVNTKTLGRVTFTGPGYGYVRVQSSGVHGRSDVTAFDIRGFLTGPGARANGDLAFAYQVTSKGGKVVTGMLIFHPPATS